MNIRGFESAADAARADSLPETVNISCVDAGMDYDVATERERLETLFPDDMNAVLFMIAKFAAVNDLSPAQVGGIFRDGVTAFAEAHAEEAFEKFMSRGTKSPEA